MRISYKPEPNPEAKWAEKISAKILILCSPYAYLLTVYTYKYFVLDYNTKLNCTCCVKLFRADCITILLDIIDLYSIIVKVNLKARGFTEFTELTSLLHLVAREWDLRVHAQW